jgi:flagellar FliJ protein
MARKFKFSLEKLLDVRKHKENEKSIKLSNARYALQEEKQKLNHLQQNKKAFLSQANNKTVANIREITMRHHYMLQLNTKIENQNEQVSDFNKKVEFRKGKLVEAMKDVKAVETLKEHQFDAYQKEANQKIQKQEDEAALRIFQNKKREK